MCEWSYLKEEHDILKNSDEKIQEIVCLLKN